ncbi:uncharacterized protein LOC126317464 [Schistocerca gregaria]|uniref:uncharacterized protein LOC126317464 n=1 Tax=Schistocerca gregaria TaxID=7010 RepID=UPI00211ECC55|nr:uncharacterized protein LOC126317464 [Schistocerca gregaria]
MINPEIPLARARACQFVKQYFKYFNDSRKEDYLPKMYRPYSVVVWCGNPVSINQNGLQAFFRALSVAEATVVTWDAQPLKGIDAAAPSENLPIIVTVSGLMSRGPSEERNFHQTFVLAPDFENQDSPLYYISCDLFRYT